MGVGVGRARVAVGVMGGRPRGFCAGAAVLAHHASGLGSASGCVVRLYVALSRCRTENGVSGCSFQSFQYSAENSENRILGFAFGAWAWPGAGRCGLRVRFFQFHPLRGPRPRSRSLFRLFGFRRAAGPPVAPCVALAASVSPWRVERTRLTSGVRSNAPPSRSGANGWQGSEGKCRVSATESGVRVGESGVRVSLTLQRR